jgi:hypothetical protein
VQGERAIGREPLYPRFADKRHYVRL